MDIIESILGGFGSLLSIFDDFDKKGYLIIFLALLVMFGVWVLFFN